MKNQVFVYIWEYIVKEEFISEFINAYCPDGDWVQLFRKAKGYIKTEFFRDKSNPNKFITIDFWQSKDDRDEFQNRFAKEFSLLDEVCEKFTMQEKWLGDFDAELIV